MFFLNQRIKVQYFRKRRQKGLTLSLGINHKQYTFKTLQQEPRLQISQETNQGRYGGGNI